MKRSPLIFRPIDDGARDGRSHLVRLGNRMALAMWKGGQFIFPASYGRALDFEPTEYYDPSVRHG